MSRRKLFFILFPLFVGVGIYFLYRSRNLFYFKIFTTHPLIYIYDDRSFDFVIKTPPAAFLIKKAAKVKAGSAKGKNGIVGSITKDQLREIAETKLPDLNAYTVEDAMKIVEGTALNMGIEVK